MSKKAPIAAMTFALTAALLAVLILAGCSSGTASVVALKATLTGAEAGDPGGSGAAGITLDEGAKRVCYDITVTGIDPATAAHIHKGAAGQAGPVVVPLGTPSNGSAKGCTEDVDPNLIKAIAQDPGGYYVNVHNDKYPNGAIRGQLGK